MTASEQTRPGNSSNRSVANAHKRPRGMTTIRARQTRRDLLDARQHRGRSRCVRRDISTADPADRVASCGVSSRFLRCLRSPFRPARLGLVTASEMAERDPDDRRCARRISS